RHEAFKDYKIHRAKAPNELYSQIPYTKKVLEGFGIPSYEIKGYEADDIIATLTKKLGQEKDLKIIIVTGDLDVLQLVKNKKIVVYTMKKGLSDTVIYDENAIQERYGLKPEQLTDYRGLKGDPSDNIPGVPGVGDKTASELLKKYGTIENLYIKLKMTIRNVRLGIKNKKPGIKEIRESIIKKLLEHEEQAMLSKHLAIMVKDLNIDINLGKFEWKNNFNQTAVENIFRELNFTSLIPRIPEVKESSSGSVSLKQLELSKSDKISEVLKEQTKKIQIAAWLLNSELKEPTLDEIYFSYKTKDIPELYKTLRENLEEAGLIKIFEEIEVPLIPILNEMEQNGFKIDKKEIEKLDKFAEKEIKKLKEKIHKLAGVKFNINSTKQLSEVLFGRMKISGRIRKTPKGKLSTRAAELEKLRETHPIIPLILEYRELQKLKTTYIDPFPKLIDPKDDRLHTTFIQTGTVTGRLASKNPNLQNIPIKTELGQEFRKVFIAEKEYKLVSLDYSQIELRIVAHIARDEKMIAAFKRGEDIHLRTAAEVFDISPEMVTLRMRRKAKALNFGIIYGMGPQGFARSAGIKQAEAKKFIEKYFEEFPKIAEYMDKMRNEAHDKGIVKNLFGRQRKLSEIHSSIPEMIRQAERMAINFPVQSLAADLIKMTMIKIHEYIHKNCEKNEIRMILQVHDEIVLEVKEELAEKITGELKEIMESVYKLDVPLIVDVKIGNNWAYA
ncbi:MAG: DNA polymerase, partial [Patescibacteria group bacterium]